jgi:hypothetical protein
MFGSRAPAGLEFAIDDAIDSRGDRYGSSIEGFIKNSLLPRNGLATADIGVAATSVIVPEIGIGTPAINAMIARSPTDTPRCIIQCVRFRRGYDRIIRSKLWTSA